MQDRGANAWNGGICNHLRGGMATGSCHLVPQASEGTSHHLAAADNIVRDMNLAAADDILSRDIFPREGSIWSSRVFSSVRQLRTTVS